MSMMLLSQWTLWLTKQYCGPPISEQVWQMLTRKVAVFDSVEGFWGYVCVAFGVPGERSV